MVACSPGADVGAGRQTGPARAAQVEFDFNIKKTTKNAPHFIKGKKSPDSCWMHALCRVSLLAQRLAEMGHARRKLRGVPASGRGTPRARADEREFPP